MGQRLNIEMMWGDQVLANAYYHWGAYTVSALQRLENIYDNLGLNDYPLNNVDQARNTAIRLLQATGAGVNDDELRRIRRRPSALKYTDMNEFNKLFKLAFDRNTGLLSVTEEGIEETRSWAEGTVVIDLQAMTFDFDVFFWYDACELSKQERCAAPFIQTIGVPIEDFPGFRDFFCDLGGFAKTEIDPEIGFAYIQII